MGILYLSVDKMKLTITFLSCLVCMTCAQYGYPQYGGYLAHQYFQQDPYYQQGYAPQQAVYYQPNLDYPAQEVGVQARIPARVQSTNPDGRFFRSAQLYQLCSDRDLFDFCDRNQYGNCRVRAKLHRCGRFCSWVNHRLQTPS